MKITRYFQSCMLIEGGSARILIDPSAQEKERLKDFGKLDGVIYTHEHLDHFDSELNEELRSGGATIYANASTAKQMKSQPEVVKDGQEFAIKNLKIKAMELPHCLMVDGSTSVQNTGYLIGGRLFHPGDGKEFEGLNAEILAVPLNGPDISPKDAFDFTKQVSAKHAIPIHYDFLGGNPEFFGNYLQKASIEPHVLKVGESIEV